VKVKFAVGMGRNEKIYEIADHSRVAEESGFSHITFGDVQNCTRDLYVKMAMAATATHRVKIGSGVVAPYTRHAVVTATSHATIDELSGGRAFLGLGSCGTSHGFLNMKPASLKELEELVTFYRTFLTGKEAQLKDLKTRSEWVSNPMPIYLAVERPKALQFAGAVADGVYFMGGPPELVKWKIDHVHRGAEAAGRDPSEIDICVRTIIYISDSKEEAVREVGGFYQLDYKLLEKHKDDPAIVSLKERLEAENPGIIDEFGRHRKVWDLTQHEKIDTPSAKMVTPRMLQAMHLIGTVDEICEGIAKLIEAGATTIATATYTIIDKRTMMRRIGEEIMPHFRN
jgi:5,10-methylenetetrahydromethanopterin reductase